jgi:hypothetical protein
MPDKTVRKIQVARLEKVELLVKQSQQRGVKVLHPQVALTLRVALRLPGVLAQR